MSNLQAHRRSRWVSSNVYFLYLQISQITPVRRSPRCSGTALTFAAFAGLLASISSSFLLSILPVINTGTQFNTGGLLLRTFRPRQRDFWNCNDAWNNNVFQHPKSIYPWPLQRNLCLSHTPPLVFPRCSAASHSSKNVPAQSLQDARTKSLQTWRCRAICFPLFPGHSSCWTASLCKRPGQWSYQKPQKWNPPPADQELHRCPKCQGHRAAQFRQASDGGRVGALQKVTMSSYFLF